MPPTLESNLMRLNTTVEEGGGRERMRRGMEEIIRRYNKDGQRMESVWTKLRGGWWSVLNAP